MTIAEISRRTGLTPRELRYPLEHDVLPGGKIASAGRGVERDFEEFEVFGIATAALMFRGGLRRSIVKRCIALICPPGRDMKTNPLFQSMCATGESVLEIGDNLNLKILCKSILPSGNTDTGWMQIETGAKLHKSYKPDISVRVNLEKLRDKLRK